MIDLDRGSYRRLDLPAPENGNLHAFVTDGSEAFMLTRDAILRLRFAIGPGENLALRRTWLSAIRGCQE